MLWGEIPKVTGVVATFDAVITPVHLWRSSDRTSVHAPPNCFVTAMKTSNAIPRAIASLAVAALAALSSVASMAADYGAPKGWRDVPDFPVFTTQANDSSGSGGGLETVDGHMPVDTAQAYEGKPSLRFNVTQAGTTRISSQHLLAAWASHDISGYLPNGYIEFNVRGQAGGEDFRIGVLDHFGQRRPVEIEATVAVSKYATITTNWQHVKVPLKDVFAAATGLDAYGAKAVILDVAGNKAFTVWLNQIKLTTTDKERGYPAIKVNQVGYPGFAQKWAKVSGFQDELNATVGTRFTVRRVRDDSVAYTGSLELVKDYDGESGERVLKAGFSGLTEAGSYYLVVEAEGIARSLNFRIGSGLFVNLLGDASKYYFYQRSGMDITAQYSDFPRQDPLPFDHVAVFESDPTRTRNVAKGWFDAGDKGKWMASGASAVNTILWSYEMCPGAFRDDTKLPESGNGVPDVLDEARWELEWILEMQDSDGGIWGKVDNSEDNTKRVIRDVYNGVSNVKPTNDTALAAICLARASSVFSKYDASFSDRCLSAARKAWVYLEAHPKNIKGPGYSADDDGDARLGAASALFRVTGEARYNDYFAANYAKFGGAFEDSYGDWVGAALYSFADYARAANPRPEIVAWFRNEFGLYSRDRIARYQGNAWGNAINNGNYYWGSNNIVIGTALEILIGSKVLGTYDEQVRDMALDALNYVLGCNAMRKSFVTGYGDDCIRTVFNTFNGYPGQGVPRGWIPLGVNRYNGGGSSNFPAKEYLDSSDEWTTNEHSVGAACNLMFIAAYASTLDSVDPKPVGISLAGGLQPGARTVVAYDGTPKSASVLTDPAGVPVTISYNGSMNLPKLPGTYDVLVTSSDPAYAGSAHFMLEITSGNPGRVANLSIRTMAGYEADTLIIGFVVAGGSAGLPVLVRGVGPALVRFDVAGCIADPQLTLYQDAVVLALNDDWDAVIEKVMAASGAFSLAIGSKDAALVRTLPSGAYTAHIQGNNRSTGVALGEIYDLNPAYSSSAPVLLNASARCRVGAGAEVLIAGFVITGDTPVRVLVRAVGPTLVDYGVTGVLEDPRLTLYQGLDAVASSDDWAPSLGITFAQAGAFPLRPGSKDAALVAELAPGAYTAHVQGSGASSGVALVEVYAVTVP